MSAPASITVHLPSALHDRCGGAASVTVEAADVRGVLTELERTNPGLHRGICDETGAVRRHLNIFVNKSNIRDRQGLDTPLVAGDAILVIPAVSGG
jgi:molybdopterin converting factor small subunit